MDRQVAARLARMGIREPDPDSQLHHDLIEAFTELGNAPVDVLTIRLMWCYHAEHDRQVTEYAIAKTEYDRTHGAGVIRYRAQGERSAEVAGMKADAEDAGVYMAHLRYRKAEQMIVSAKKALDILHAQLGAWQTNQADARAADSFTAREGV